MIDRVALVAIIAFAFLGMVGIAQMLNPPANSVPPTNAFSKVVTDTGSIEATTYNSELVLHNSTGIGVSLPGQSLTLSATRMPYAQISDLTSQQCAALGAASNVTLNTNDEIYKITHSTSSKSNEIKIQESGIYQFIAVPQVGEVVSQGSGMHNMWIMKNNAKLPNTNIKTTTMIQIGTPETMTGTLNWVGYLKTNDILSLQQSCDSANLGIVFTGVGTPPATPSIIVSIAKVSQ